MACDDAYDPLASATLTSVSDSARPQPIVPSLIRPQKRPKVIVSDETGGLTLRPKRRPHSVCNRTPRYLLSTCDHHHRAPSTHKHNIPLPSELLPKAPYLSLQGLQAFNILSRMRSQDISVALALVLSLATFSRTCTCAFPPRHRTNKGLQAFNILSRMRSQDISVALALVLSLATLVNGVRMGNSPQLGVEETLNVPDMIHSRQPNIGAFGRSLLFGSSTGGGSTCAGNQWQGTCGALSKKTDKWSSSYGGEEWCCSPTFDGCCEVNGGAVAGLVIGVVVFIAIVVSLSVWACKRNACCCYNKPVPPVVVAAVPMAPMGYVNAGGIAV
eukprot:CAMPEP_0198703706 /NCGR_PEP_ID=MMETSP1468-20131203/389498_1 /TAXON_ID=1461545 /ORGANISM="Mantoniella sp, Strain CCMP1436" /LENGTH=328 /DNA_ID=CAMNT_0044462441 /DNA_START=279 /DNA_END=1266 /DNA_ORIENTATION=-